MPGRSATSIAALGGICPPPGPPAIAPGGKLTHPLELLAGGDLLGEQRGLDAVEQALQPADQLRLGDPQLAVGRDHAVLERQGEVAQLVLQIGRQRLGQLHDGALVDLGQALAAGLVEGAGAHLLEQLLDHRADAHHLGRRGHGLHLGSSASATGSTTTLASVSLWWFFDRHRMLLAA